ncbi:sulfur carrier protein adenylyltransferase thiF [Vibrio ishigakensis]|uniref:Sulfur carrier protein adenylyltransferase thiF n=1 Tax=Vibrio ishigakensis TaxID=1481914 RepID=A0A0B8PI28_9VIBR|nr:sulfur carrier protein adenylyltransferase thiF [Vibrio ishigakensis]
MLTDQEFMRYQRQIMLPEFGEVGQSALRNAKVLVIGCGGLGHAVATQLAASGVGSLVLFDFDKIELSNLHRQTSYRESDVGQFKSEALKRLIEERNSGTRVRCVNRKADLNLLRLELPQADLVVDCTDNFSIRHQVNQACVEHNCPLVSGAAIGWDGQLVYFSNQHNSACYSCLYPSTQDIEARNCSEAGVLGANVNAIAHLQAMLAIRSITEPHTIESGALTLFDGRAFRFSTFQIDKDTGCSICSNKEKAHV